MPDLNLASLWRQVKGGNRNLGWVLVLSFALQALLLVGPWHVQWLVDQALLSGDQALVWALCAGFAVVLVLRVAVHWVRALVVMYLGHNLAFMFASQLFSHLLRLPLAWFQARSSGDVIARFGSLGPVRDFFTLGAVTLLVDGMIVVISGAVMLAYAWQLALVVIAMFLVGTCCRSGSNLA